MTNELLPTRRTGSRRMSLLALAGAAVLAVLLSWQSTDWLDRGARGDDEPVVTGAGAPAASTAHTKARASRPIKSPPRQYDETDPAGLVPQFRARLARATAAAAEDGVTVTITSARRSTAKQQQLFNDAIVKYGSYEAATRWVLPPADSAHVHGRAVDLGPRAAMRWMDENGWRYGICRRYDNEPWHFEPTTKPGNQCPPREPYAVPKSD